MPSGTPKLVLVVALVAGAVSVAGPVANAVPTRTIKAASGNRWQPSAPQLLRKAGRGIVKWKNPTTIPHNVASINTGRKWKMRTKALSPGSANAVIRTFKKKGTYWFRCTLHSVKREGKWTGMVGKVRVR